MIVTDRDDLAKSIRLMRSHGMTTLTWDRHQGHAHSYDVVALGYNYRIDEIRSALGLVQLGKLEANNVRRRDLVERYRSEFSNLQGINIPYCSHHGVSAAHLFPILISNGHKRLEFINIVLNQGIQVSIHYPPIHQFSSSSEGKNKTHLPITEDVASREVTLPLFPTMSDQQLKFVVSSVRVALKHVTV